MSLTADERAVRRAADRVPPRFPGAHARLRLGRRGILWLPVPRLGKPVRDRGMRSEVVVLGELGEDTCGLLCLLASRGVREDPVGIHADDNVVAEAVARLPRDPAFAQPVQGTVEGIVILDVELDAPIVGHQHSVPHQTAARALRPARLTAHLRGFPPVPHAGPPQGGPPATC